MHVLLTGSSGLIGSALTAALQSAGHRVTRMVRGTAPPAEGTAWWDPDAGRIDRAALNGLDAVVHLAGESLAARRWTAAHMRRIRESRVNSTSLLATALAELERPPRVVAGASATGYYGTRGDEILNEDSPAGQGFLADTCREWEAAAATRLASRGVRLVHLRFGIVLSPRGGALARMLPVFKMGLGGPLGFGRQYMSWIALEDAVRAIEHTLVTPILHGPVNLVSPQPVTNREFTLSLARVLRRPAFLFVPAFALRLAFGRMADEALLASTRVIPQRLLDSGFQFQHPQLEGALRAMLT